MTKRRVTVTMSSRGQLTIPKWLRERLGITPGVKLDVYPRGKRAFEARVRHPSRILEFAGDLAELDAELRQKECQ
jgi:AbrB family looped-hinge helix DNA binding protein